MAKNILLLSLLVITCALVAAFEPSPLQDLCVADPSGSARVNGFACMDPKLAQADHFVFSGLHVAGNTSTHLALGLHQSQWLKYLDSTLLASHWLASIIHHGEWSLHMFTLVPLRFLVIEGSLEVGFVTSNPDNRLITKVLQKGDVFVFPVGLVHFQRNAGNGNAFSISGLSSQNPGVITIANAVFGSNPAIADDLLAKAFQIDKSVAGQLQAKF